MDDLDWRGAEALSQEFIHRVVHPALSRREGAGSFPLDCESSVILKRGSGRLTLSYRFADGQVVFGKLYSDGSGSYSAETLEVLWGAGFGKDSSYQVSEPLGYLLDHNLLLTRGARGASLLSRLGDTGPAVLAEVRHAARWLVKLHQASLPVQRQEDLWESMRLVPILQRITKASARAHHERKRLMHWVEVLCQRGKEGSGPGFLVLTHGRYHSGHIYVDQGGVTVIDFDRVSLADPAKDLAEFVATLRHRTFQRTGNTASAEAPTREFLGEYLSELPGHAQNLAIHWGAFLLLYFLHSIQRAPPADPETHDRWMRFYESEFDLALSERWLMG